MTNSNEGKDKTTTITVNGRQREVSAHDISFDEVVALASLGPGGPDVVFTITYKRGHGNKPEGTMVQGDSVKVKEGMIFNVTRTDKS